MTKSVEYLYTHKIVRETLLAACIDQNLTSSAKAVLACLFAHANTKYPSGIENGNLVDENGKRIGCFPSQETIAAEAQISENAVSLAVQLLRKEGYIKVKTSKLANGHKRNNEYLIELTRGKSPQQIRTEGKARLALLIEGNESPSSNGASRPTRVGLNKGPSRPTRVGPSRPTRVGPSRPTRVGSNIDKLNEEKSNIDASLPLAPSPLSSLLHSPDNEVDLSSDNEVDLSPDTSSDVDLPSDTSNEVDFSPDKSNDVNSSLKNVSSTRKHSAWWEVPAEIRELSDHDLGVRSSPDGSPDAYRAERREKIQRLMERLDADNLATAVSPALSTMAQ